jgi:adenylate kinase
MKNYKRIGFYGVSGVGKTTILKEISQLTSNTVWLEGAKLVLDAAKLSLEDFKKVSETEKYHFREVAINQAFEVQKEQDKHIIIDGHLAFAKGENQFENVMTENDMRFYTDFIYLKLAPETILERQLKDSAKKRDYSVKTISNWIDFELTELEIVCKNRNINLHLIESENNQICIDFIIKILNRTK